MYASIHEETQPMLELMYVKQKPKRITSSSRLTVCSLSLSYSSLLTILVLPSGPQYEVTLRGEVVSEDSGKPAIPSAAHFGPGVASDVPPILSNKQFVAWGGVTLGRAV